MPMRVSRMAAPPDQSSQSARASWRRLKALFTEPVKLPGWAVILLVVIAWIAQGRIGFWLSVAKAGGAYVPAAAISSPFLMPLLLIGGLAWIAFARESEKGMPRHHWLRTVGWSIFAICLTAIVLTAGYGTIQLAIQEEVGKKDAELQKQYAVHPVYWHLNDLQKLALGYELDKIPPNERFEINILCLPDTGSRTYVQDLGGVFRYKGWKVSANCLSSDVRPDLIGMYIAVSPAFAGKKRDDMPSNVRILADILDRAHIAVAWFVDNCRLPFATDLSCNPERRPTKEDDFAFVVGNPP